VSATDDLERQAISTPMGRGKQKVEKWRSFLPRSTPRGNTYHLKTVSLRANNGTLGKEGKIL
jgi:hypothetical protein